VLGPRWLRDAPLPERPGPPRPAGGETTASTAPMEEDGALAATVAPATHLLEPGAAPEPRRRPRRRVAGLARLAVVLVALVTAVAGATTLGGGRDPRPARRAAAVTVGNGQVALTAPAGWREARPRSTAPLPVVDPVTIARGGDVVTAGVMTGETAANVSLLPPGLLRGAEIPPRSRVVLRAQGIEAWRYRDLRPDGSGRPLTVYVVPTTAGVAAVACAGGGGLIRECESIASTLRTRGGRLYALGPSPEYADALDRILDRLERRARVRGAGAGTPTGLQAMADEYRGAARSLARLELSPADHTANRRLVTALEETSRAYRDAAAAVGRGDAGETIQPRIDEGQTAIDGALAGLGAAGYRIGANDITAPAATGAAGAGESSGDPSGAGGTGESSGDPAAAAPAGGDSGVGDSRSDDPSDDEPDENDNGD
jgi:hypothetical protein